MFLPLPFYMYTCSTVDPLFYALHFCLSLCFIHLSKMSDFSTVWIYCNLMGTSIAYNLLLLQKLLKWTNDLRDIFTMECSSKTSSLLKGMVLSTSSSDFLPGHWWTLTDSEHPPFFLMLLPPPRYPSQVSRLLLPFLLSTMQLIRFLSFYLVSDFTKCLSETVSKLPRLHSQSFSTLSL